MTYVLWREKFAVTALLDHIYIWFWSHWAGKSAAFFFVFVQLKTLKQSCQEPTVLEKEGEGMFMFF